MAPDEPVDPVDVEDVDVPVEPVDVDVSKVPELPDDPVDAEADDADVDVTELLVDAEEPEDPDDVEPALLALDAVDPVDDALDAVALDPMSMEPVEAAPLDDALLLLTDALLDPLADVASLASVQTPAAEQKKPPSQSASVLHAKLPPGAFAAWQPDISAASAIAPSHELRTRSSNRTYHLPARLISADAPSPVGVDTGFRLP